MPNISKSELIKLQKKFTTDKAIAERFGVTRQAIHHMRKKLGVGSSLADNPQRNASIVAHYKKGTPGTKLAKKFDISISQAYRIINDAGAGKNLRAKKKTK